MDKKLLTVAEAAALCRCSKSFFYQNLLAKGKIRSITMGRSRRIPADAIDEFIARELRVQAEDAEGQLGAGGAEQKHD